MNKLRKELGIDDWLELVKEDQNLNGAYISFAQYIYILENQLKQRDEVIAEAMRYIKKNTKYYDREYSKIYGELCDMAGAGDTRLHVVIGDEELLEILQKYKGDNNG